MKLPKPRKIIAEKYVAGLSLFKSVRSPIKLSANESALGPSPKAVKSYNSIGKGFVRYPDSDGTFFRKVLAKKFRLEKDRIILGSGSDQIFELVCKLFLNKGDEVVVSEKAWRMSKSGYSSQFIMLNDKVSIEDFNLVMDVHFQGSLNCTHTIFPIMREQEYGRIIFTSSASGVYGNFGQTNYGSAKMAMIGLMNTLKLEGQNKNIFTNSITPVAYTRMTEGLIPEDFGQNLKSEYITPAVIYLASDQAPNGVIIAAGAGVFSRINIQESMGVSLGTGEDMTPENIHANWDKISDMTNARALQNGGEQTLKFFELINK